MAQDEVTQTCCRIGSYRLTNQANEVQRYLVSRGPMLRTFLFGVSNRLEGWFWFPFCPRLARYSEENLMAK